MRRLTKVFSGTTVQMPPPHTDTDSARSAGRRRLAAMAKKRPLVSQLALMLLVTAFLLATANAAFFARVSSHLATSPALIPLAGVMAFAAILFCIAVITLPWLVRPVLALSLVDPLGEPPLWHG